MSAASINASKAETITRDQAIAASEGSGLVFQVGAETGYFVGAFRGVMFSEGDDGSLDQIDIACPANITIHIDSEMQDGEGHCVFQIPNSADVLYSRPCQKDLV